jgi:peptidoglycan hydrolase-like protein with peptidoglycan-binding domain
MRVTKKLGATALAVAAAATTLVAAAGPSQAATTALADCTKVKSAYVSNGWYLNTPGYDATSGSHFNCNLQRGDENEAVRWLQYTIFYCYGYSRDEVTQDGKYGVQTENLVKSIQRAAGLEADGIYGPATRKAMMWRVYSPSLKQYSIKCYQGR